MDNRSAIVVSSSETLNKLSCPVIIKSGQSKTIVKAVWDTGATCTCISPTLANELKLQKVGEAAVISASHTVDRTNIYKVDIIVSDNIRFSDVCVCEMNIQYQQIGILIGMDLISQGDFAVSNFNGQTTFTFRKPSKSRIEFTSHEQSFAELVELVKKI